MARSLEGLFRLVGERELADRVRTAARRVTRRQGEGSEEEEDAESEVLSALKLAVASRLRWPSEVDRGWRR